MSEITEALALICEGRLTEVRLFDERGRTHFGYFDEYSRVESEISKYPRAKGVYFVPNEINPDLLARSANVMRYAGRGETTGDQHVIRRRWLLVDLDPHRVTGVSSTDEEKEHAKRKGRAIFSVLRGRGFPDPVVADSGNGIHLLYRLDLEPEDGGLVENCLKALDQQFSDAAVAVDMKVFNPARIWKLYGTVARKGSHTATRPHRAARVLSTPTSQQSASRELLEALAATFEAPDPPAQPKQAARPLVSDWNLDTWLSHQRVAIADGPVPYKGGRKWTLECCPFNDDHRAPDACVFELPGGQAAFSCSHNSCSDKKWRDFRQHYEPGCYDRAPHLQNGTNSRQAPGGVQVTSRGTPEYTESEVSDPEISEPSFIDEPPVELQRIDFSCAVANYIDELTDVQRGEVSTGIPGLDSTLYGGFGLGELVVVAARPSHGKTMFAMQLGYHMSLNRPGMFITLDMSVRALAKRALQFITATPSEYWSVNQERLRSESHDHHEQRRGFWIEDHLRTTDDVAYAIDQYRENEGIEFVIIDYVQSLASVKKSRYEAVTEVSGRLRSIAMSTGITVIALAQLNREIEKRSEFRPQLSDLKESGQIEQDADVVLGLVYPHRIDSKKFGFSQFHVYVLKNRNRATGDPMLNLDFNPARQKLSRARVQPPEHQPSHWDERND